MDKVCKEFFNIYLTGCEKTWELIKQEIEQARNLLNDMITTIKNTLQQEFLN